MQLGQVQTHPIVAAGDLRRIGAAANDRFDDDRVAGRFRRSRNDDAIAQTQPGVGGESFVDRDRARATLCEETDRVKCDQEGEARGAVRQRRAEADQCAVSFNDSRVSARVYEGAA